VTGTLKHAARVLTPASVLVVLAGLGFPAVAIAAAVVVLALAALCWVLGSRDRSDWFARIILGIRGDARFLYSANPPQYGAESAIASDRRPTSERPTVAEVGFHVTLRR
jgi:hypothetical protein